jgi:hypothetical protein
MELEGSLPHLQVPPTCMYPEPVQSSPCPPPIPLPEDPFEYYPPIYAWVHVPVNVTLYGRKGKRCPAQVQGRAFTMKVASAVSSYVWF